MRFLRDRRMGNRLHVFICIRDHVLASVFESEHATRYMDTTYIRILDWDDAKIRALLRAKVSGLPSALLTGGEPTVAGWLGRNVVRNVDRDVDESVEDYLVRHTRLIPRDVVVLGNALCDRMLRGGTSGRRLTDQEIRDEVRHAARVFGREQLAIVANHIASDLMHAGAALQAFQSSTPAQTRPLRQPRLITHRLGRSCSMSSGRFRPIASHRCASTMPALRSTTWFPRGSGARLSDGDPVAQRSHRLCGGRLIA